MEENKMTKMTTKSSNIKGKYRRGDKIKTYKVFWDSVRLADKPLIAETSIIDPENPENNNNHLMAQNVDIISSTIHDNNGLGSTMIAGQLIIYDLDEEPPINYVSVLTANNCIISREGLFVVALGLGAISITLFIATLFMYFRLSKFEKVKLF
ncbi:unnamed protein product [Brugia pahangi]|uniref:Lectin_legB domain-containing protein n=1 Tax=Brugia pahangi TaxID=6280 RepID=A0A0N4TVL4_BRUPA|nr:unnamed protein product [Brugia pahangi]